MEVEEVEVGAGWTMEIPPGCLAGGFSPNVGLFLAQTREGAMGAVVRSPPFWSLRSFT